MPPATLRAFGFATVDGEAAVDDHGVNQGAEELARQKQQQQTDTLEMPGGKDARIYKGLGSEVGPVTLASGQAVAGGRLLMRDTWNADLTPELRAQYAAGLQPPAGSPPDVWIHKNRMSGLWGAGTPCTDFLEREGITTLLFAGVNTDQCVGGSLQDAFTKGWDCVLLSDGAGTTSPAHSQDSVEFNCAKTWGFVLTCADFAKGVEEGMVR